MFQWQNTICVLYIYHIYIYTSNMYIYIYTVCMYIYNYMFSPAHINSSNLPRHEPKPHRHSCWCSSTSLSRCRAKASACASRRASNSLRSSSRDRLALADSSGQVELVGSSQISKDIRIVGCWMLKFLLIPMDPRWSHPNIWVCLKMLGIFPNK